MTDDKFIREWHNGNGVALHWMWTNQYRRLMELGEALLGDIVGAEEVVSVAFGNCWEMRKNFKSAQDVCSFLLISVRNAGYDGMRWATERPQQNLETLLNSHNASFIQNNAFDKAYGMYLQQLYDQLKTLPATCQHVFRLSLIRQWKHSDIAIALDIKIQAIHDHLCQMIEVLKEGMHHSVGGQYILRLLRMALLEQGVNAANTYQNQGYLLSDDPTNHIALECFNERAIHMMPGLSVGPAVLAPGVEGAG